MVLFPLALIWVAAVLFFVIRRSLNTPDEPGSDAGPPRFRRPPGRRPRDGRGSPGRSRSEREHERGHSRLP